MATIRDVARLSGYSITTVSRVLNHSGYVSQQALRKIKQVMQQLDYVPNETARDLSNGQNHKIGVILPQIRTPYFAQILNGVAEAAFSTDYSITLLPSEYNEQAEVYYLEQLRRKEYAGLIITSHGLPLEKLAAYTKYGSLVLCEDPGNISLAAVFTDRYAVFIKIFRWLQQQQIKRIACMFYRPAKSSATTRLTLTAYQEIYQTQLAANLVMTGISSPRTAYLAAQKLAQQVQAPQCILTNSDSNAVAVRQYYIDQQLPIPIIIGQGYEMASFAVKLPTINYHLYELGQKAFEIALADAPLTTKIKLPADFISQNDHFIL
ncbi:LacI family DNA-binding transcriptional regulator [Bombilactobacillus bombi]|uniref:LacI family DNA-binding transcriptional regulator n=1 Tax=Bombilactobacillus bombi TaxID=1303590 RepID=UPI000E56C586|nr:LacI family DNA-binding transcriptional regulator [Bombilactobacillus bombi]AXX65342.1 LacI family DNA-binding transcriptional regulator [Bombilactobacillus bombi]